MVHCCVLGCRNRSERKTENVTFHTFPKDEDTRNKWIEFTGKKNWNPSKYDRMCSKHFESYCIYKTKYKVHLKTHAVPTLSKHYISRSLHSKYLGYNNNEPPKQTQTNVLPVHSQETVPSIEKEATEKISDSSQLEKTKDSEADVHINGSQDDLANSNDEMDEAITAESDKDDDVQCTYVPDPFPVRTTPTVKDEPEDEFAHNIEVTVECDVEDNEQNALDLTSNAKNTQPVNKEPKSASMDGNSKNREETKVINHIKPIEKLTSAEEQEKINQNSKVLEIESITLDDDDQDEVQEEDLEYFQWKPLKDWKGFKRPFLHKCTGPTSVFTSPYGTFRAYWDNNILSYIVTETNKYANTQNTTDSNWTDTNIDEILILFAFWIMLGIIKMPTIKSCYAHNVPILKTDVFRRLFSESRYMSLMRFIYIINNTKDPSDQEDCLSHFRNLIDHLNVKFKNYYNLEQDICIDESNNLWETNCPMGIKIHCLCESKTGYIWSIIVDSNKTNASSLPDVVYIMKLLQPLLNLGHTLYTDSWFSTPILARYLAQKHVNFVGTLHAFKDIPPVIKSATLNQGEFVARHCGDLMAIAYNGGKRQYYLSTYHDICQINDTDSEAAGQQKLTIVDDYERGLRRIDSMDYCIEPYLEQQNIWQLKLFKILLNISIHNAHILLENSTNVKFDSLGFRLSLVQAIIERHHNNVPRLETTTNFPAERLTGRHFIRRISIPGEEFGAKINNMCLIRKTCVWCKRNGRDSKTTFECPECNVALCLDECFEEFHTISA